MLLYFHMFLTTHKVIEIAHELIFWKVVAIVFIKVQNMGGCNQKFRVRTEKLILKKWKISLNVSKLFEKFGKFDQVHPQWPLYNRLEIMSRWFGLGFDLIINFSREVRDATAISYLKLDKLSHNALSATLSSSIPPKWEQSVTDSLPFPTSHESWIQIYRYFYPI